MTEVYDLVHSEVKVLFSNHVRYEGVQNREHVFIRTAPRGFEHETRFPADCILGCLEKIIAPEVTFNKKFTFHPYSPEKDKTGNPKNYYFSYSTNNGQTHTIIPLRYIQQIFTKEGKELINFPEPDYDY